jgi:DegV family protein with EDD domain
MSRVAVVTDSTANLDPVLAEELGIRIVPIMLQLDGSEFKDEVDITAPQFYEWFAAHPDAPVSTSCPSPGAFLSAYRAAQADADAIVSIHVAGGLSTTLASASQAALSLGEDVSLREPIELVDSGSVSMGCGFSVLAAARVARQGGTAAEVATAAREVAGRTRVYAVVDTLRYIARSGRVPAVVGYAMAHVRVYPLLQIGKGKVRLIRVDRTRSRSIQALREVVERTAGGLGVHMAVLHAAAEKEAVTLARSLERTCECLDTTITEFTPVMGAHTGPGLLGAAFYPEEMES